MSTSLRSHFRGVNTHDVATSSARHKQQEKQQNNRTISTTAEHSKPRQPSKLAKRSSRNLTSNVTAKTPPASSLPTPRQRVDAVAEQRLAASPAATTNSRGMMHALSPPPTLRTPSLISGSSASTFDSPRSNVLRRKPSTIEKFVARKRNEALGIEFDRSTMHSRADGYNEAMDDSVFGISMPPVSVTASYTDYVVSAASTLPPSFYSQSPDMSYTAGSTQSSDSMNIQAHDLNPSFVSRSGLRDTADSPLGSSRAVAESQEAKIGLPIKSKRTSRMNLNTSTQSQTRGKASDDSQVPQFRPRTDKRSSIIPPELAHLDVENRQSSVRPPQRPSRDNTPDLSTLDRVSPVVQSDMTSLPSTDHRRSSSRGSLSSVNSQSFRNRFGMSPRLMSKLSSPPMRSSPSPAPQAETRKLVKVNSDVTMEPQESHKDVAIEPVDTAKTSRFGFLSRKSKPEPKPLEKPKREPRKGPAAGTGHERYGKFGFRGRSGSISSSSNGRSSSSDSVASAVPAAQSRRKSSNASNDGSDLDDFLRERLAPRVLRGSGSNFSAVTSPSVTSVADSMEDITIGFDPASDAPALQPSSSKLGKSPLQVSESQSEFGSQWHGQIADEDLPDSFNESPPLAKPQTRGSETDGKEGLWLRPLQPEKKSGRKWNFLQRAQSAVKGSSSVDRVPQHNVGEARLQAFDNAADCALLDAVEPVNLAEVREMVLGDVQPDENSTKIKPKPQVVPYESRHRSLLPSPPGIDEKRTESIKQNLQSRIAQSSTMLSTSAIPGTMASRPNGDKQTTTTTTSQPVPGPSTSVAEIQIEPAKPLMTTPDLSVDADSPRIPRLSPIGRIPRVVSKRDRERKLPDVSFSRPFASTQPKPSVQPPGTLYTKIRDLASPVNSISQSPEEIGSAFPNAGVPALAQNTRTSAAQSFEQRATTAPPTEHAPYTGYSMFSFPSRKNSGFSYTSSSDATSMAAWSSMPTQHEDIWSEYDEWMDQVTPDQTYMPGFEIAPSRPEFSALGVTPLYPALYFGLPPTKEPSSALPSPPRPHQDGYKPSKPPKLITPPTLTQGRSGGSYFPTVSPPNGLYQQISAHLHASPTSTLRHSFTSSRNSQVSMHSRSASLPDANMRSSHTSFVSSAQAERRSQRLSKDSDIPKDLQPSIDLKLDLLMASKSLTFGRVLFSPAHNEMKFTDEPKVLVLDGLGSEWSHFAALSYPQATVYNLGPSKRQATTQDGPHSRSNHRSINHPSIDAPFPFPRGFFTAAVLRFPVATTDQAYHACICEVKRVLRPGGHLEVSVLDIDLSNMGHRARKAIRGLKTRMQQQDEDVSLRSLSDFLLQSIGKRGFENVQRCVIGVPVTGRPPRSQEISSVSSGSERGERLSRMDSNGSRRESRSIAQVAAAMTGASQNSDISPETEDEKMTKMVARVGRWWYSASYEKTVLKTDRSIWTDNALLRECQRQGTSFKLLICCAQKPTQPRRRTVSV